MRYRYTGDAPRLFPTLPGGPTLNPGDEFGAPVGIVHPDIEPVKLPPREPPPQAPADKEAK